jgi:hypothetical protein
MSLQCRCFFFFFINGCKRHLLIVINIIYVFKFIRNSKLIFKHDQLYFGTMAKMYVVRFKYTYLICKTRAYLYKTFYY